jgi:hypothetical protein
VAPAALAASFNWLDPSATALAAMKRVPISELASERIIRWERRTNPAVFDRVVAACRSAGCRKLARSGR